MSSSAPHAASVIIPTKNRKETLRRALQSVFSQTVPLEVLVMDDASSDETGDLVRREFPQAKFYREEQSRGPAFQRNKGADLAESPHLVTLDDDCVFGAPDTIERTLRDFDHPRIGAVTIPFVNVLQDATTIRSAAPAGEGVCITLEYYGGMIILRRDAFLAAGGYRPYLFMHVEEPDLAVRMLDAGYLIRLGRATPIQHFESPVRDRPRVHELGPRNHVLYSWYNVPMPYFPLHLLVTSVLTFKHGVKIRYPGLVAKGLLRGYYGCLHEWRQRRPVTRGIYRLSRDLKKRGIMPFAEVESRLPLNSDRATEHGSSTISPR